MIERKPMIPTELTPNEIIGYEFLRTFTEFIKIAKSGGGEFPRGALRKEFGKSYQEIRAGVAAALLALRNNGFYPDSINGRGDIIWMSPTKSVIHEHLDKGLAELQKKSQAELSSIARGGWKKIVKNVTVEKAKGYEINREREIA